MSYNSSNTTSSAPQHRLHNPNEPLPGSQHPVERGEGHLGTERSPQISHSSSERPVPSDRPSSVETNVYAPSDDPTSERSPRPVERGTGHVGTERSPQISYSSSERPVSSDQPSSVATNVCAPSDDPTSERSQNPTERGEDHVGTERSPQIPYLSSDRPVSSDRPTSVETNEYAPSDDPTSELSSRRGVVSGAGSTPPAQDTVNFGAATQGRSAYNSARPLGVEPTSAGGVAIGGQSDLREGRAGLRDKIIGKTQKVVGKTTDNPELHEKGELRETGGKAAAEGRARAAHD